MRRVYEVKTTFESKADAQKMCENLLDKKLVACGQIGEIESHYVWQNKREIEKEFLLVMKTTCKNLGALVKEIRRTHPYELPEIVVLHLFATKEYFDWVKQNTKNKIGRQKN